MRIGIITWFTGPNYGTNLQAIALQYYLRKQGYEVELINCEVESEYSKNRRTFIEKIVMGFGIKTKLKKLFPQPINTPIIIMPSSGSELKDKVVLISGGTGGIGLEIARNFLLSGAKVIITGTNERKFEKIKSEISNDKLKFIVLDYKEPSSFESKLGEIINI